VAGGVVLGSLAQKAYDRDANRRSVATGAVFGLLISEGLYRILYVLFFWAGPIDRFVWRMIEAAVAHLGIAILGIAVLLRILGRPTRWLRFMIAAGSSASIAVAGWYFLESARSLL
jgi:hypothetical protein